MRTKQQLIVIEGPTASGKTALAVDLAKKLNTVVISADSRQFYKETDIGTAKPTMEEMSGIKHFFIDSHSIQEPVSAGTYESEALELLQNQLKNYDKVILVGGSGMFIDALCLGLDPIPVSPDIQNQLRHDYDKNGLESLLVELKELDPVYATEVDQSNPSRVLRALEVIRLTGKPYSEMRKNKPKERPFQVIRFVLDWPRAVLYDRINKRVDNMMEQGLLEEVKQLYPYRDLSSLQTVGYKELFDYLEDKYTLSQAIDKIKQHTRNYAKRQLTWFRRHENAIWINPIEAEDLTQVILEIIQNQPPKTLE